MSLDASVMLAVTSTVIWKAALYHEIELSKVDLDKQIQELVPVLLDWD